MVEPSGFEDGLDMDCEKNREVQSSCLQQLMNDSVAYRHEED